MWLSKWMMELCRILGQLNTMIPKSARGVIGTSHQVDWIRGILFGGKVAKSIGECYELVQFAGRLVSRKPESFAVAWVTVPIEMLLLARVDHGYPVP